MKYQFKKIAFVELFLIVFALFHFFVIRNIHSWFLLLEFVILSLGVYKIVGTERREERAKKDLLLVLLVGTIAYYVFIYFLGFFLGFVYSTYSHTILGVFRNVVLSFLFIVTIEMMRECIIKKGKYYKALIILSVFVFAFLELITQITVFSIHNKVDLFQMMLIFVVPLLSKNIFLTFSTYYTDKVNSIIYQMLMEIPAYLIPVLPNLGDYLNTVLLVCQPLILVLLAYRFIFYKRERISDSRSIIKMKRWQKVSTGILLVILIIMIYLISGYGRFSALAIGSTSMTGTINKGDVVIIDKKEKEYKKRDIIAFVQDGEIIVHRIIDVMKDGNTVYYQTKGDANNGKDSWFVDSKDIVGQCRARVLWIGWPTVLLSEFING